MALQVKRLRERRQALRISQKTLAGLIGTNQGQISKVETGESAPSSDLLAELARVLEVSADWLLGLSDEMNCEVMQADLNATELEAVSAWRHGERLQAIKTIVLDG
jgi:transcriptional regulator with XRE-family HTH domain